MAARRWGPSVGGLLSSFPVVAGPILFFICLEQGTQFASQSAYGTLLAVPANLLFGLSYSWLARKYSWPICIVGAMASLSVIMAFILAWQPTILYACAMVLTGLIVVPRLYPTALTPVAAKSSQGSISHKRKSDIAFRMIAAALMILVVTHFSTELGPRLSGFAAMFPVIGTVLAVFSHRQEGAEFTANLMRGMAIGFYSFSGFCLVLHYSLSHYSIAVAFALALITAAMVQAVTSAFILRARH